MLPVFDFGICAFLDYSGHRTQLRSHQMDNSSDESHHRSVPNIELAISLLLSDSLVIATTASDVIVISRRKYRPKR